MNAIAKGAAEVWGLFVDDAGFSVEIVIALVTAELAARLGVAPQWRGPLLFVLAAAVLAQSVWRKARQPE